MTPSDRDKAKKPVPNLYHLTEENGACIYFDGAEQVSISKAGERTVAMTGDEIWERLTAEAYAPKEARHDR